MQEIHLPPSSQTVLSLLETGNPMTHKDLVKMTNISPRTVRYAIRKLKEAHLIIEKFNFRDARQTIYQRKQTAALTT
jgi:predicted transcriptional regulator